MMSLMTIGLGLLVYVVIAIALAVTSILASGLTRKLLVGIVIYMVTVPALIIMDLRQITAGAVTLRAIAPMLVHNTLVGLVGPLVYVVYVLLSSFPRRA
jgi:hypothetical protein